MRVRAQIAKVFHLDKCIGCHTCSVACKNVWTDRRGAEYMWWNNVETKPGTGYPTLYEDQERYHGGWERRGDTVRLRLGSRLGELANLFFNPRLPTLDDYYQPWTYRYGHLVHAPPGGEQPIARAVSAVTGAEMEPEAGPNWDDDLGGSSVYAARDPNLRALDEETRRRLFRREAIGFFYVPRICNHCLNPGCLAACPAGAIYKRGEDGIVLVGQDRCRGWRMCVSGCPYKKVYFNWESGKSEKCILCYPRQETQQVPACSHVCVGRIRYLGVLLYDADGIAAAAARPDPELVEAQRALILDPFDPAIAAHAIEDGVHEKIVESARRSPVYKFVKAWRLALPQHPEFRTLPMVFYVPPLLPVLASAANGRYRVDGELFTRLETGRAPLAYLAQLFAGGNSEEVAACYRKLFAGRLHRRSLTVGDVAPDVVEHALEAAGTTPAELDEIHHLTAHAAYHERFVVPPLMREIAIEERAEPRAHQGEEGAGFLRPPRRGP